MTNTPPPVHFNKSNLPKTYRNHISKVSNKLALTVFLYYSLLIIFSNTFKSVFIDLYPQFLKSFNTDIKYELISIFSSIFATLIPILMFLILSKQKLSEIIHLKKVKLNYLFPVIFIGMAVAMIANFSSDIIAVNFSLFNLQNTVSFSNQIDTFKDVIIYIISTAVTPAISEELIFRGVLTKALRKYGDSFAIITSSLIFATIHGNISQIPFTFLLGLILAFSVCKTNSVFPAIIIHFINNLYAVILDIIKTSGILSDNIYASIYYITVAFFCILGIISFVIIQKDKSFFTYSDNKEDYQLTLKEKMLSFTLTPATLLIFSLFTTLTISNIGVI